MNQSTTHSASFPLIKILSMTILLRLISYRMLHMIKTVKMRLDRVEMGMKRDVGDVQERKEGLLLPSTTKDGWG